MVLLFFPLISTLLSDPRTYCLPLSFTACSSAARRLFLPVTRKAMIAYDLLTETIIPNVVQRKRSLSHVQT